ncbi:MAG: dihydroorotate dehydrogenase electron transfer subunit [Nitrospinae bacterium]|nr:dihydroorotate dehydrogenase electron transfer subunit [Nitrospinota bacterium]
MKRKIIRHESLGGRYRSMDFEWPDDGAKPGQFVMVRISDSTDPLLRRPMSIANLEDGLMSIIYNVAGRGTSLMAEKRAGEAVDVLGPFGTSFDPPKNASHLLCVMGGVGAAPFLFLKKRNKDRKMVGFYGAANKDGLGISIPMDEMHFATEDGSVEKRGLVTDVLLEHPAMKNRDAHIMACGPKGMLRAVDEICVKHKISGELSLEERMGCGFGVCLGCAVETDAGNKRACVDGPVFKAGTIRWRT